MKFIDKIKLFLDSFFSENKGVFLTLFMLFLLIIFAKTNTVSASSEYEVSYLSLPKVVFTTDYKANNNTRVVLDFEVDGLVPWTSYIGPTTKFLIQSNFDSNFYSFFYNDVAVNRSLKLYPGRHVIDINKCILSLDNIVVANANSSSSFQETSYLALNCNDYSGYRPSLYYVYSFKIYENDILVRDYVPYYKDGSCGFFETVNNKFIAVSGSTCGETVRPDLKLSVSTTETTSGSVKIFTQDFSQDIINNYKCYYSYSYDENNNRIWYPCEISDTYSYYTNAFQNGAYVFRLEDLDGNTISTSTMNITNISYDLQLRVSSTSPTSVGVHIYTQSFPDDIINNYKLYIKYPLSNGETSDFVNIKLVGAITSSNEYKYWATSNGVYTFKLVNDKGETVSSATMNITNIVPNMGGVSDYNVVVPELHVYVENAGQEYATILIRTQSFSVDLIDKYRCIYWSSGSGNDANTPFDATLRRVGDEFYFEVVYANIDTSTDKDTYYFKFYDNELEKYSSVASITVDKPEVLANADIYNGTSIFGNFFKSLFVPNKTNIDNLIGGVTDKFSFVDSVKGSVSSLGGFLEGTKGAPKLIMTFNHEYLKGDVSILDLSWYEPFKPYGDLVLTGFIYLFYLWRLFISLPNIISGVGGGIQSFSMGQEIEAYRRFGFGRSSSITNRQGGRK